jgi:hypothetical protein
MKKKPFILLEILIALFLVILCGFPLIKEPLKLYHDEIKQLEKMEKERLADWTFTEIKEILLKNGIPWEKIPAKGEKSEPFPLLPVKLEIPGSHTRTIDRSFILSGRGEKMGEQNCVYRQLGIYIHLGDDTYAFRLPVQKQ